MAPTKYHDLTGAVDSVEAPEPFRFQVHGEKFELSMEMRPEQRKAMGNAMTTEDLDALLNAIFGAADLARLDDMDLSVQQLMVIVGAYNEQLGEVTGESLGEGFNSTSSSKSTGTPSKRISRTTSH